MRNIPTLVGITHVFYCIIYSWLIVINLCVDNIFSVQEVGDAISQAQEGIFFN